MPHVRAAGGACRDEYDRRCAGSRPAWTIRGRRRGRTTRLRPAERTVLTRTMAAQALLWSLHKVDGVTRRRHTLYVQVRRRRLCAGLNPKPAALPCGLRAGQTRQPGRIVFASVRRTGKPLHDTTRGRRRRRRADLPPPSTPPPGEDDGRYGASSGTTAGPPSTARPTYRSKARPAGPRRRTRRVPKLRRTARRVAVDPRLRRWAVKVGRTWTRRRNHIPTSCINDQQRPKE